MGIFQSKPIPKNIYSSTPPWEEVTPYSTRRHPHYKWGVMQLPPEIPNAQKIYLNSARDYRDRNYLGKREILENGERDNKFTFLTYGECFRRSRNFCASLINEGIKEKDYLCIFSENRAEWVLTMDASYLFNIITVPLYDTFSTESLEFAIKNTNAKYICVSHKNLKNLMECDTETLKTFECVILFDSDEKTIHEDSEYINKLESLNIRVRKFYEMVDEGEGKEFEYASIDPEDILYVCYSSGTTGFPKGIMLSHRSYVCNLIGVLNEGTRATFQRHLSYLPLSHVFERMCCCTVNFYGGCIGFFSGDARKITDDLMYLKPTVFIAVPRVLSRFNDVITETVKKQGTFVQTVFETALVLKKFLLYRDLPYGFIDKLVFSKVQRMLGGEIEQSVIGSAAMPPDLHERLQLIFGFPIRSGFGLSEGGSGNTIPPNKIQWVRPGTCGYPLGNVELRIEKTEGFDEEGVGEILMGGTGICSGYLNDPEATANLFTDESHTWIHTGDIGKFDDYNCLVVVDRMRSIFKLSQGEYVAADALAAIFEDAPLVQQMFVYGDSGKSYLIGICNINRQAFEEKYGKMPDEEFRKKINTQEFNNDLMDQINQISKDRKLLGYQKIKKVFCVDDHWTIENGLLSPTFKLKRKAITNLYKDLIERAYA